MIKVNSTIKMDWGKIQELTDAAATALEQTAEYLHTEVVQAQVMPFDTGTMQGPETMAAGQKVVTTYPDGKEVINEITKESGGKVSIVTTAPQVRRLYFHPEYHFQKHENPNAGGEWYKDWLPGGSKENDCKDAFKQIYKRITGV